MAHTRLVRSPAAMAALGARLAPLLRPGDAVFLSGGLGAGKSTLARGLIRALTRPDLEVPSPTFTLVQFYEGAHLLIAHFDLYRLKRPEEAFELGLEEALSEGAALIEWPERLNGEGPQDRLDVEITEAASGGRRIRLCGAGAFAERFERERL